MIYFIQNSNDGYIKIGHCNGSIAQRLSMLQTGNPYTLYLLEVIKGGHKEEKELHKRFAYCRVSREWFAPSDGLMDFLFSISDKQFNDPVEEAEWCAEKYLQQPVFKQQDFLKTILRMGGHWDLIVRSTLFYPKVEQRLGNERVNCFWGEEYE